MKTLIIAVNSKYIHTALAPWYLKASCDEDCDEISVAEYTINDSVESVVAKIYSMQPEVAAFSCYIWNIEYVLKLAEDLKKVIPDITLILGGPEVSYDSEQVLQRNPFIDYVLSGEGESNFPSLLKCIIKNSINRKDIGGLAYRNQKEIASNPVCKTTDSLDSIPSPYTAEMLSTIGNRIVYFESSRGCPFSCSYCLSSVTSGVRHFSMERVGSELDKLVATGVRQIKFVDRTFNSSRLRAKQIFMLIVEKYSDIAGKRELNFHFEIAADLFDEEMFTILSKAPKGLIQFEIGVQTTNEKTLDLIDRKTDMQKVFGNSTKLKEMGNIHLHLDLIAGLPGEDYTSFCKSFNEVYSLKPNQLQLGFLKMLKGSKIRKDSELYAYKYRSYAPYEVLENNRIRYLEMIELKGIEELVDRYYNSGRFVNSLAFIHKFYFDSPVAFYKNFLLYNKKRGTLDRGVSARELFVILMEYIQELPGTHYIEVMNEFLKFDYLSSDNTNNLPAGIKRTVEAGFREKCFSFLKDEENVKKYFPAFVGIPAKQIFKNVHFEKFMYNNMQNLEKFTFNKNETVVLFDYTKKDKVTGLYRSFSVNFV